MGKLIAGAVVASCVLASACWHVRHGSATFVAHAAERVAKAREERIAAEARAALAEARADALEEQAAQAEAMADALEEQLRCERSRVMI